PDQLVNGPDNMTPTVAVNKDGVVCVNWYDRREFNDDLGWNIRLRCSLDGGDTWSPSTKVTDQPTVFGATETWNASGRGGAGGGGRGGRGGGGAGSSGGRGGGRVGSLPAGVTDAHLTVRPRRHRPASAGRA